MDVGSWTDHGATGVTSSSGKPYNAIDPNLVVLSNGAYQMNFGSFWGDLYQVPMTSPTAHGSVSAAQVAYDPSGAHSEEGSFLYYRSGYYYLFYSHGQCCGLDSSKPAAGQEYQVRVCRSTSSTSGFVSLMLLVLVAAMCADEDGDRLIRAVKLVPLVEERSCCRVTIAFMRRADSQSYPFLPLFCCPISLPSSLSPSQSLLLIVPPTDYLAEAYTMTQPKARCSTTTT